MKPTFEQGKIVINGRYFEEALYDISNEKIAVLADGCGGLKSYRVNDFAENFIATFLSLDLYVGGKPLSPYIPKKVEMIGRMQKITLQTSAGDVAITTFLSESVNGVFFSIESESEIELSLNCRGAKSDSKEEALFVEGENFLLSSSHLGDWVKENDAYYLKGKGEIKLLLSFAAEKEEHLGAFSCFDRCFSAVLDEINSVKIPSSVRTEEEKAYFLSAYFTALENRKTVGKFRAFAAGINYTNPLRTYYRDSYFTTLPLYGAHPDLLRDELLTLAAGVGEDGSCASAVKSDFTLFWGDHFDSPSFFVIQVSDYVRMSGDETLLAERVKGRAISEIVKKVLDRLIALADETGLLRKEGAYNKRDWADEVNRSGYVTYVEALYYRALLSASTLFRESDPTLSVRYDKEATRVKKAINDLLWDESKGYYVNYQAKDRTEDNLSLDTIFLLLFGVADEARANRVLDNAERLLETANNAEQGGGEFGVMCVYPPYAFPKGACHKSARAYDYHNGANWVYLTAMYAYAKARYGRDWRAPLLSTFRYMTSHGRFTPVEYFSPCRPTGSALQGWSAAAAFVWQWAEKDDFFELH